MNEILNAFTLGLRQGTRAYFAPVRWVVNALCHAANDAFDDSPSADSSITPSR